MLGKTLEANVGHRYYKFVLETRTEDYIDPYDNKMVVLELYLIAEKGRSIYSSANKVGYIEVMDKLHIFEVKEMMNIKGGESKLIYSTKVVMNKSVKGLKAKVEVNPDVTIDGDFISNVTMEGVLILD